MVLNVFFYRNKYVNPLEVDDEGVFFNHNKYVKPSEGDDGKTQYLRATYTQFFFVVIVTTLAMSDPLLWMNARKFVAATIPVGRTK